MNQPAGISPLHAWILAIRPKTLPASAAPVVVGTAAALADSRFALLPALAALAGSLLLQIGVNLANDYFDHMKGIDSGDRLGPLRVTQSGLIPARRVRNAMILAFVLGALVGLYLIQVGGWPILVVGAASIISALAYSGGPYPLASHGLGDVFVFVFFGLVAVCGTYYVQALQIPLPVVMASVPVGLLITAILVVNNLRDIGTDSSSGKRTLAVMMGEKATRREYAILVVGAYLVPALFWAIRRDSLWILLPLVSVPLARKVARVVMTQKGPVLNEALAGTARIALVYSLLLGLGLVLSS